ncbi:MFS family permease [Actinoplanes tereljensis]|uniref:Major facilitator superfamily (MFS) profile domain-containing protein n=1 Tax=Paractinoplanes tereljensis TaxID=571912 RepID=A0A919NNE7_9ACTN|nr:MFS transporter [Actinoplanes tereljensis]GIF21713.1 hypothetical protein Ate02nite_44430 [Actinoplanes tereljensis]
MSLLTPARPELQLRQARFAVAALFFTNGALFANLIPRYPQIKADLGLSNAVYGLSVAAFPTGAIVAGLAAGVLVRRFGSATVATAGTLLTALGVLFAGVAPTVALFAAVLFLAGAMDAITDVAQNAHGLRVQRRYGRSIINSFHAIWSIGAVTGGAMAAAAIALDLPRSVHLGFSGALFVVVAFVAHRFCLPGPEPTDQESPDQNQTSLEHATPGAANPGPANLGAANLGAANLGAANLGAANLGPANLGAGELGAANPGAANLGAANPGAGNLGAGNLGAANLGPANLGAGKLGAANPGAANLGAANLGAGNLGAGNLGAGELAAAGAGVPGPGRVAAVRAAVGPRIWLIVGALVLIAIGGTLVEDAGNSWAAVYLSGSSLHAAAAVAAWGYIALVGAQFVGRLIGDRLVDRFGQRTVARAGGVIVAAGMGLALAVPTVPGTILGFAAAGFGVATLVPAAMHEADELPGLRPGTGLTVVSWLMRLGFLLSPPVVGAVADATSLRAGLLVVPIAGILVILLAGVLQPRRPQTQAAK